MFLVSGVCLFEGGLDTLHFNSSLSLPSPSYTSLISPQSPQSPSPPFFWPLKSKMLGQTGGSLYNGATWPCPQMSWVLSELDSQSEWVGTGFSEAVSPYWTVNRWWKVLIKECMEVIGPVFQFLAGLCKDLIAANKGSGAGVPWCIKWLMAIWLTSWLFGAISCTSGPEQGVKIPWHCTTTGVGLASEWCLSDMNVGVQNFTGVCW